MPSICNRCGDGKRLFDEICDSGTAPGCLPDCMGEMDGYDCSGGNDTSPSVCTISVEAAESLALVSSASKTSSTMVGLQLITTIPQIGTLGPTYFLMIHMHQLL